jgi:DNA-binding NarL/FixJ family response regulator
MVQTARVGGARGLLTISRTTNSEPAKGSRNADKPRIVLIDPRPLTRESVVNLLNTAAREFSVLPISAAGEITEAAMDNAGLVLLNVGFALLSDAWVEEEIRTIAARMPQVPLILLCDSEDIGQVTEALGRGVRGYIPTTFNPRVAVEAMRLVHAGGTFVPASALRQGGNGPRRVEAGGGAVDEPAAAPPATPPGAEAGAEAGNGEALLRELTPRQREVLRLLCEGKPNKIIAHALHMQEGTVKVHVRQIMKKLKATNRTQVAFLANRVGLDKTPGSESA